MPMRPCWAEIRIRALEENMRFLASLAAPHAELLAMVKANAYGHSLALCAPAAVRAGAGWLGVTSVEEGIAARALCPDTRVLIMSGFAPGQAAAAIQFQHPRTDASLSLSAALPDELKGFLVKTRPAAAE